MADNLIQQFLLNNSTPTVTLKKTLDAQALRQKAHAQNIANAETPGYQRMTVDFEDMLKAATENDKTANMQQSNSKHMPSHSNQALEALKPNVRREPLPKDGNGVNGVDIDQEMAEMAETQLRYLTALELLKRRYTEMKSVIRGQ